MTGWGKVPLYGGVAAGRGGHPLCHCEGVQRPWQSSNKAKQDWIATLRSR